MSKVIRGIGNANQVSQWVVGYWQDMIRETFFIQFKYLYSSLSYHILLHIPLGTNQHKTLPKLHFPKT
jgi:hypothetical protein